MMKETVEKLLQQAIQYLKDNQTIPNDLSVKLVVDRKKDRTHGDFATQIALVLAKPCKKSPRELAELIVSSLAAEPMLERVEIAGPGFINFFMKAASRSQIVSTVLSEQDSFGLSKKYQGQRLLLEYVSANPTGPLHVGHGRGAAFGASLAALLKAVGYSVHSEYYVNDAGRQMSILAVSVWLRYLSLCGEPVVFPSNAYRGEYVQEMAAQLVAKYGTQFLQSWTEISSLLPADEPEGGDKDQYIDALIEKSKQLLGNDNFGIVHKHALNTVLDDIKCDLSDFGVVYDEWFSEQRLLDEGAIASGVQSLSQAGHTYEKNGAIWFKATAFGDEKDRVLVRANGQSTYFASDVAYHWNKYERGFDRVIDVFGADHHGYISRLKSAVKALGHDDDALTVLLVQFAILYRDGERVQMSTRSGSFVTLRELREEVGKDAARFFYVQRKSEQHMDFDLNLAKSESSDNPVYYIQYAYARISSVFKQLHERGFNSNITAGLNHLDCLSTPDEINLITLMNRYPELVLSAAEALEPHQIAYYLRELANGVHCYYNSVTLLCEDENLRSARLCLLNAVRVILRNGLHLLGVSCPESM